jgi:NAD(P)-dependent dehydrogenase (short-subunit alcohol dehydrogenase family)
MADDTSTPDRHPPDLRWRLDGRVALVTGASSGLGARFVHVLHQAGARQVIEVNLLSVMDLCRLMAPLLLGSPVASVINIASIYGVVSSRGPTAAYNASKGAVVNLTSQLAAQWGGRGVRVNALAPGYFPSEMTGFLADEDFARSIRERTLLARTPALHEIDGPLLFLATDSSSYMTGHVLIVDGGWTAV